MGKTQRVILDLIVLWGVLHMVQGIQIADVVGDLGVGMTFDFTKSGLIYEDSSDVGIKHSDACCSACQQNNVTADAFVYSSSQERCHCLSRRPDKVDGLLGTVNGTGGLFPEPEAGICVDCVKEDNYDYLGDDIPGGNTYTMSADECADACARNDECNFWTYAKNYLHCWMKYANSKRRYKDEVISGNKACGKVAASSQREALALTVPVSVTEKSCHNEPHGIPCCPVARTGDNAGASGEHFVQEAQYDTDKGCAATCQELYPTSAGITESKTQSYGKGGHKCWCEMGTPVFSENEGYQTCMFK